MAADLDLPVDVVGCPLVREPDGLAMSSRNAYLDADDRQAATMLSRCAVPRVGGGRRAGERDAAAVAPVDRRHRRPPSRRFGSTTPRSSTPRTLEPVDEITTDTLVALAAFVGKTRLIDNVTITFAAGVPTPDLGVLTAASGMQEADH